jgi:hypothetical protein
LCQKSVLPEMDTEMSQKTRQEVLARMRRAYAQAGSQYKAKLLDQAVELFGYHRKAAIRALRASRPGPKAVSAPAIIGRPKEYRPEVLLPVLKPIWFGAFQPCGARLHALLPEWLPAYEQDHRRINPDVREALLCASARTLNRLLGPLRVVAARKGGTRPGSLLRQSIPIRGEWTEEGPGWMEVDTVALCGGRLDDLHLWMLDGVDIRTDWTEQRAVENRGAHSVLAQIRDVEESLPFTLLGIDSDNGGEFINHHLMRYAQVRPTPLCFTRARAYKSNDNAHVEQRNYTHVRQHFGYERYDNPAAVPLINALCKGALGQMLNHFLPTQKLSGKRREGNRTIREYGDPQTPYTRVLKASEVSAKKKRELQAQHAALNPMTLARQIETEKKEIERCRILCA